MLARHRGRLSRSIITLVELTTLIPSTSYPQSPPGSSAGAREQLLVADPQEVVRELNFPVSMLPTSAPPGCAVTLPVKVCRANGEPAKAYELKNMNSIGWGTRLISSELVNGCVVLNLHLSVDHTGTNNCREPLSRLAVTVVLR
jgi:hypothetical protein